MTCVYKLFYWWLHMHFFMHMDQEIKKLLHLTFQLFRNSFSATNIFSLLVRFHRLHFKKILFQNNDFIQYTLCFIRSGSTTDWIPCFRHAIQVAYQYVTTLTLACLHFIGGLRFWDPPHFILDNETKQDCCADEVDDGENYLQVQSLHHTLATFQVMFTLQ